MGSSGSGNLGNYDSGGSGASGGGGGGAGGGRGRCREDVETALEEVARSGYSLRHKRVPPAGTAVELATTLVGNRLAVVESSSSLTVGVLPTRYNYLLACLGEGFTYVGLVTAATPGALPELLVRLEHVEP